MWSLSTNASTIRHLWWSLYVLLAPNSIRLEANRPFASPQPYTAFHQQLIWQESSVCPHCVPTPQSHVGILGMHIPFYLFMWMSLFRQDVPNQEPTLFVCIPSPFLLWLKISLGEIKFLRTGDMNPLPAESPVTLLEKLHRETICTDEKEMPR